MERKSKTSNATKDKQLNIKSKSSNQTYGEISYYAGMPEWEGWAHAPLIKKDIFYFSIPTDYDIEQIKLIFPNHEVSITRLGKIKLIADCHLGQDTKSIRDELALAGIQSVEMKSFKNIKRRNLNLLPKDFFKAVIEENTLYIKKLIYTKYASQVEKIVESSEDIPGLAAEIAIELATSFDAEEGVPFGAYVAMRLSNKLVDRARAINGRTLNDFATHYNKILDENPDSINQPTEIARLMNMTYSAYNKKLFELNELRSAQRPSSLSSEEEGQGSKENLYFAAAVVQVESPEEAYLREEEIFEVRNSFYVIADKFAINVPSRLLSNTIVEAESFKTSSGTKHKKELRRVQQVLIGMKTVYLRHWENMNTSQIAKRLGYSISTIKTSELVYQDELRKHFENR